MYLKTLLEEFTNNTVKIMLNIDNQSTLQIIDVNIIHYLNEKYIQDIIDLRYCPTDKQLIDMLTKSLSNNAFEKFKDKIIKNKLKKRKNVLK